MAEEEDKKEAAAPEQRRGETEEQVSGCCRDLRRRSVVLSDRSEPYLRRTR